jgi:uncharacterized protein (DUF2336 family)
MIASLSGLEELVEGQESPRRAAILSALTSQYVELEPRLSDRHIDLYDNVFTLLVKGIELHARVALSEKLAPMARAPRETINTLANDEHAIVAAPVLQQSPVLDEMTLVRIAETRTEGHRCAMAQREGLGADVTKALVKRHEPAVFVNLIGNGSAKLSSDSAGALAEMATSNSAVAQALASRLRLPAATVGQMLHAARALVVETLARAEPEETGKSLTAAVDEAMGAVTGLPSDEAKPQEKLSDQQIVTLYVMKSYVEVEDAVALRSGISADLISDAFCAHHVDAMLIALKAAGFSMRATEAMLSVRLSVPIGSRMLREPLEQFERINTREPARMMQFALEREKMRATH